jgi:molecular chaperone HscB
LFDFNQNYFALFGLSSDFVVDLNDLTRRYREVQVQVHPDRFVGKSEQEQRVAMQAATFANEAYQCLRDPLRRAQYLLKLAGCEIETDAQTHQDAEFLMQQMELREQLEQLANGPCDEAELDRFVSDLGKQEAVIQQEFLSAYREQTYSKALELILKWQFLVKLRADANRLYEQLDG